LSFAQFDQPVEAHLAHPAGRLVHRRRKLTVSLRVHQQPQVGEDVLVLFAVVEARPFTIWNGTPCFTKADSSVLERALIRRKMAWSRYLNFPCHLRLMRSTTPSASSSPLSYVSTRPGRRRVAVTSDFFFRCLLWSITVAGRVQDGLRAASYAPVMTFAAGSPARVEDVYGCPIPPLVNALVGVSDPRTGSVVDAQPAGDLVLRLVGVLVLVDEHVLEPRASPARPELAFIFSAIAGR
jgi:hypothetical protein